MPKHVLTRPRACQAGRDQAPQPAGVSPGGLGAVILALVCVVGESFGCDRSPGV
jgi:hypothetical protein